MKVRAIKRDYFGSIKSKQVKTDQEFFALAKKVAKSFEEQRKYLEEQERLNKVVTLSR